jgi:S-adenosylmethionine:tRNA ribosyltransferase-isomerase
MKKSDFYFDLPERLIAQEAYANRDQSKLMVIHRDSGLREHRHFFDLPGYIRPRDVLVLNDTKVIPARLYFHNEKDQVIEVLLIRQTKLDTWICFVSPGKRAKVGQKLIHSSSKLVATVIDILEEGERVIQFDWDPVVPFLVLLDEIGKTPIPPYIKTDPDRWKKDYQTVYAKYEGSVAAPTAGFHFTDALLDQLREMGVYIATITLHIGPGTFKPVKTELIENHKMDLEYYEITEKSTEIINSARRLGGRCFAVGTTVTRTLESSQENGQVIPSKKSTNLFITPGYQYKIVDALITNFHLPESTLIMLVSAFYDRLKVLEAYQDGIVHDYRFYSFGDAMLVL